jgi:AcrR family transcriptional regulator
MATQPAKAPPRRQRQDTLRNERAIIDAYADLLREGAHTPSMPAIAERCGLSLATAYRHFPAMEDLTRALVARILRDFRELMEPLDSPGPSLYTDVMEQWLEIVTQYRLAASRIRPQKGFAQRYAAGDPAALMIASIWGKAIRRMMAEADLPNEWFVRSLSINHALFNSSHLLDLLATTDLTRRDLALQITSIYLGALRGLREHSVAPRG